MDALEILHLGSCLFQDFTSARYVRLRLQKIRTLNADLMFFQQFTTKDLDPSVTRRVSLPVAILLCLSATLTVTSNNYCVYSSPLCPDKVTVTVLLLVLHFTLMCNRLLLVLHFTLMCNMLLLVLHFTLMCNRLL